MATSVPVVPAEITSSIAGMPLLDENVFQTLSTHFKTDLRNLTVMSTTTFHEGKILNAVLQRVKYEVAEGAAIQCSVMGYITERDFECTFKIKEKEYNMMEIKRSLGIAGKLAQNAPADAISFGRLCRVFASQTYIFLDKNPSVVPVMFKKFGNKVGLDRRLCFIGAENIIDVNSENAKKMIRVQAHVDKVMTAKGTQTAGERKWENKMIDFFIAKGMTPVQAKGVPKKKVQQTESED